VYCRPSGGNGPKAIELGIIDVIGHAGCVRFRGSWLETTMGNRIIRGVAILLVSTWPVVAGLIGFAIVGIADSAGNDWALAATMCATIAAVAFALLADLAGTP
jgi:hypothetical protein